MQLNENAKRRRKSTGQRIEEGDIEDEVRGFGGISRDIL